MTSGLCLHTKSVFVQDDIPLRCSIEGFRFVYKGIQAALGKPGTSGCNDFRTNLPDSMGKLVSIIFYFE